MSQTVIEIFAPAKLNMFLHITGKRADGYHILDSLMCFADIGDIITIADAPQFSFHVQGAFSSFLPQTDHVQYTDSNNLVVKAATMLASIAGKPLQYNITLTKNLPVAAGIGGGSADAAAVIWGLCRLWGIKQDTPFLKPMMTKLGADVPACLLSEAVITRGIGDEFHPAPHMPDLPVVMINPLKPCPTGDVFLKRKTDFRDIMPLPQSLSTPEDVAAALKATHNDLAAAAIETVPAIANCLNALETKPKCLLSRMSGSGATCFGLFATESGAHYAAAALRHDNPDWWIMPATLNRVGRY